MAEGLRLEEQTVSPADYLELLRHAIQLLVQLSSYRCYGRDQTDFDDFIQK